MTGLYHLTVRNCKLFFKDKGMFFTSLVTPLILLVLYATFLGNVYQDSMLSSINQAYAAIGATPQIDENLIDGAVAGQLFSSLLAVSCITVAFCSNMLMVQDKVSGARRDLTITPVKSSTLSIAYFLSTAISTLLICLLATAACLVYVAIVGWYFTFLDVLLIICDVFLLSLFGTALSSVVNFFLSTQGQLSAVGTIVSAGYGFICGAYMPISSFSTGLQKVVGFLPGTYGTSLLRRHCLRGVFAEMEGGGLPFGIVDGLKSSVDYNFYFFDTLVQPSAMYLILGLSALLFLFAYILCNAVYRKKKR